MRVNSSIFGRVPASTAAWLIVPAYVRLSELRFLSGCPQLPEGGVPVSDEQDVVVLVSPGDGGEGI